SPQVASQMRQKVNFVRVAATRELRATRQCIRDPRRGAGRPELRPRRGSGRTRAGRCPKLGQAVSEIAAEVGNDRPPAPPAGRRGGAGPEPQESAAGVPGPGCAAFYAEMCARDGPTGPCAGRQPAACGRPAPAWLETCSWPGTGASGRARGARVKKVELMVD